MDFLVARGHNSKVLMGFTHLMVMLVTNVRWMSKLLLGEDFCKFSLQSSASIIHEDFCKFSYESYCAVSILVFLLQTFHAKVILQQQFIASLEYMSASIVCKYVSSESYVYKLFLLQFCKKYFSSVFYKILFTVNSMNQSSE